MNNYSKYPKYRNTKVETTDGLFDSKKEARRWQQLKALEKAGAIKDLQRQVAFEVLPHQRTSHGMERAVKYIADFVYTQDGKTVVEDTKGVRTKDYIIKRKLMLYFKGIEVKEI